MHGIKRALRWKRLVVWIALALSITGALFPIYWILITSFKSSTEIYRLVPTFWPSSLKWDGYVYLMNKTSFPGNLLNTLMVALIVSGLSLVFSSMAAYAIARLRFKGRSALARSMFYAYIMPKTLLFIPVYSMVTWLGLNNNIRGLIFIYPTLTIPYAAWMLTSYFKTIPFEIEEAGIVDGCTRVGCMLRLVLPLSLPGLLSVFVFCISICWSEYLYALIIVTRKAQMTVSLCLSTLIVGDVIKWAPICAGAILSTIPVVAIYALGSGRITGGLTSGGVKG